MKDAPEPSLLLLILNVAHKIYWSICISMRTRWHNILSPMMQCYSLPTGAIFQPRKPRHSWRFSSQKLLTWQTKPSKSIPTKLAVIVWLNLIAPNKIHLSNLNISLKYYLSSTDVFEEGFISMSILELKTFILTSSHLPQPLPPLLNFSLPCPSNGIKLMNMEKKMMKKINPLQSSQKFMQTLICSCEILILELRIDYFVNLLWYFYSNLFFY